METGLKGQAETRVEEENLAVAMGSGNLEVFATPAMVALMEQAAAESVLPFLQAGESTVGTVMNIRHTSATPIGMAVRAESVLDEIEGRRLVFTVKAYDAAGPIGEGSHERYIVQAERFLQKAGEKYGAAAQR